jgi:hypothetical protein
MRVFCPCCEHWFCVSRILARFGEYFWFTGLLVPVEIPGGLGMLANQHGGVTVTTAGR